MLPVVSIIYFVFLTLPSFASEEAPQTFTIDGRLYSDSAATTPLADVVSLKVQILDPAQTCIVYEEVQSVNTTSTSGYYTIQIGQKVTPPAGKRSSGDSNNGLTTIFSNSVSGITGKLLSDGTTVCTYNPTAGDLRYVKFTMTPAGDNIPRTTTSNLRLDSVPMALVAERAENLRGLTPSQLLQVNGTTASLTQANLENIFSTLNYPNLVSLLSTAPANYVLKNSNGSTNIPSVAGAPGSGLAVGQIWYDSTNNQLKYYDGAVKVVGSSTAGTLAATAGGTGQSSFAVGDLLYANTTTALARLPASTSGYVLTSNGAGSAPSWQAAAGGGGSLSSTTAATTTNSINNANFAQTWNWNSATTESPLTLTSNAITTGSLLNLTSSSAGINSTNGLLNVANSTATTTGTLARLQANSTAGSGLTILNSGNVGIGTSAPNTKLHIVDSSQNQLRVETTSASSYATIRMTTPSRTYQFGAGGAATPTLADKFYVWDETSANAPLVINSSGNVGIGTTTPSYKLDVLGGFFRAGFNSAGTLPPSDNTNGGLIVGWNRLSGGGQAEVNLYNAYEFGPATAPAFLFSQKTGALTAEDFMSINRNGNVGIGTTSPGAKLHISNALAPSVSANYYGLDLNSAVDPTVNISGDLIGARVKSEITSSGVTITGSLIGSHSTAQNAGFGSSVNEVKGGYFQARNVSGAASSVMGSHSYSWSNNTATNIYGSYSVAERAFSVGPTVYGSYSIALNSGGGLNVTSAYGNYGRVQNANPSSSIVNAYGGYFDTNVTGGNITNAYGVYTGTIAGTNKFSIYATDATAPSYFAGNVGIGASTASTKLHVIGTSGATIATFADGGATTCTVTPASTGFACSSDERLKKNIETFSDSESLENILKLRTVTYDWRSVDNGRHTGYLAQEIEKVAPEFVRTGEDGFKQVNYTGFVPWITGAIKALYGEFKSLSAEVKFNDESQSREIATVKSENLSLRYTTKRLEFENESMRQKNLELNARVDQQEKELAEIKRKLGL